MKPPMRLKLLMSLLLLCALASYAQEKRRVFVTDSNSWEVSGGFAASNGTGVGAMAGGARPQTAEIMRTFSERCPGVTITIKKEKADFAVILDHEGGKGIARRDNKIAVFGRDGDMVFSTSTRALGNAVKAACAAILNAPVQKDEKLP